MLLGCWCICEFPARFIFMLLYVCCTACRWYSMHMCYTWFMQAVHLARGWFLGCTCCTWLVHAGVARYMLLRCFNCYAECFHAFVLFFHLFTCVELILFRRCCKCVFSFLQLAVRIGQIVLRTCECGDASNWCDHATGNGAMPPTATTMRQEMGRCLQLPRPSDRKWGDLQPRATTRRQERADASNQERCLQS